MEERLLNRRLSVDEAIEKVNEKVNERFDLLDKNDNDVEKWASLPKLVLLDEVAKKRIVAFIEYMDTSYISIDEKCRILISLSGLIENGKIKLYDYENGSLYLLADHYQDSTYVDMDKTIILYKTEDILIATRNKTLDENIRLKILLSVEKSYLSAKIDNVSKFIKEEIKKIEEMNIEDL